MTRTHTRAHMQNIQWKRERKRNLRFEKKNKNQTNKKKTALVEAVGQTEEINRHCLLYYLSK